MKAKGIETFPAVIVSIWGKKTKKTKQRKTNLNKGVLGLGVYSHTDAVKRMGLRQSDGLICSGAIGNH